DQSIRSCHSVNRRDRPSRASHAGGSLLLLLFCPAPGLKPVKFFLPPLRPRLALQAGTNERPILCQIRTFREFGPRYGSRQGEFSSQGERGDGPASGSCRIPADRVETLIFGDDEVLRAFSQANSICERSAALRYGQDGPPGLTLTSKIVRLPTDRPPPYLP